MHNGAHHRCVMTLPRDLHLGLIHLLVLTVCRMLKCVATLRAIMPGMGMGIGSVYVVICVIFFCLKCVQQKNRLVV